MIFTVPLFSESVRKVQANPKKIYAIDSGMANANLLQRLKNHGRALENLVYLDLRRQGHTIFYYVTKEGYEVDFLVKTIEGELKLYQVALNTDDPTTLNRELRALYAAEKELGIKGELIDSKNYLKWIK